MVDRSNSVASHGLQQLSKDEVDRLDALAHEVAHFSSMAATSKIFAGKALLEARRLFPSNEAFGEWRAAALPGLNRQVALEYMQVAREYGDRPQIVEALSMRALRSLAAPSTPQSVRDEVEAKAESGEAVTAAEIDRLKREAAEAARRIEAAEAARAEADKRAESLLRGQEALVAQAKSDAETKARADLDAARKEAEAAQRALFDERKKLADAAAKAEETAMEHARAKAADLAQVELDKLRGAAEKAKREEAEARQRKDRLAAAAESLKSKADEYRAYNEQMRNSDLEAKELRECFDEVNRALTMALVAVADIEHAHGPEVQRKADVTAQMCRQFADSLMSIRQAPETPAMRVVSND